MKRNAGSISSRSNTVVFRGRTAPVNTKTKFLKVTLFLLFKPRVKNVVLNLESVDETLVCNHSNENYRVILSYATGTVMIIIINISTSNVKGL